MKTAIKYGLASLVTLIFAWMFLTIVVAIFGVPFEQAIIHVGLFVFGFGSVIGFLVAGLTLISWFWGWATDV